MWILQADLVHRQLSVDIDIAYQLSSYPAYLLLARLLLISCKEFICCFEVGVCDVEFYLQWSQHIKHCIILYCCYINDWWYWLRRVDRDGLDVWNVKMVLSLRYDDWVECCVTVEVWYDTIWKYLLCSQKVEPWQACCVKYLGVKWSK